MKNLKLYESFDKTKKIDDICNKLHLYKYHINSDGTVDVDNSVIINKMLFSNLPIRFGKVNGFFSCKENMMTHLKGSPSYVSGDFYCAENNLVTLKGAPKYVGGDFNCHDNDLKTLEGLGEVHGDFYCHNNKDGGRIRDEGGKNKIYSFEFLPKHITGFYPYGNPINEVWSLFADVSKIELFNDYDIIRGKSIILDRLNDFLLEIGKPSVKSVNGYICYKL